MQSKTYLFFKRIFDIILSVLALIILSPIFLTVFLVDKFGDNKGPVFFKQLRIGKNHQKFYIYKFRSMIVDADQILHSDPELYKKYVDSNYKLEPDEDPRVTKLGAWLRKTSIDEIPQFVNVLKGEMSFIGPRPYLPREKEDMGQYYDSIIKLKPGVTGMWQANGRSDVEFSYRCKLDDYYYHNWSIWLDFTIMYKTVKSVVYGKGSL